MPLQLARAVRSSLQPEEGFFQRMQRHCQLPAIRCLPVGKSSKVGANEDVVKCLSGDVNLLCAQICQDDCADLSDIREASSQEVINQVSCDVQKQLSTVLDVITDVTADRGERTACQKHTQGEAVELLENFIALDLPVQLLIDLPVLQFEARKDVMNICCALLWPGMPQQLRRQVLGYVKHHPRVFSVLVKGYGNTEVALQYGVVLRSYMRHAELVEAFLESHLIFDLLHHARNPSIDISADAIFTLREVLLEHKEVSAAWLEANFRQFFAAFNGLLDSGDYLLQRQALTLMSSMFLDRHFKKVMVTYVNDDMNLRIHMNLLLSPSRVLRYDAFQVFKVFAANPQKPRRVHLILFKNKQGLVKILEGIQSPRADDERLSGDLRTVIERLGALGPRPAVPL
mmetsp:Transcript_109192/g.337140  ORF Transcript_109192/g.337140 Transcript_109192/m.337140 type:complete len:400 (+) Transcript_109192:251-1450(+)